MIHNYFWITIFGILGVLARYQVGLFFEFNSASVFPFATLTVNLVGAFLIGFIYILLINSRVFAPHISMAIMIGFLGGFTTFSSMTLDVFKLVNSNHIRMAIAYITLSISFGILFTFIGAKLAKIIFHVGSTAI